MTSINKSVARGSIRKLCLAIAVLFAAGIATAAVAAAPCPRTPPQSIVWIDRAVDSLVRSAYAAYRNESAQTRYQRVVDALAESIQRCRLTNDSQLVAKYPEFFQYVRLLSIAGRNDHELGFEVSDTDYFAETSQYTTIPDFLLPPPFLRP